MSLIQLQLENENNSVVLTLKLKKKEKERKEHQLLKETINNQQYSHSIFLTARTKEIFSFTHSLTYFFRVTDVTRFLHAVTFFNCLHYRNIYAMCLCESLSG